MEDRNQRRKCRRFIDYSLALENIIIVKQTFIALKSLASQTSAKTESRTITKKTRTDDGREQKSRMEKPFLKYTAWDFNGVKIQLQSI